MEKDKRISLWKVFVKFLFSGGALYIVLSSIDRQQFLSVFLRAHFAWLFVALLLYNASKILSSFRLNYYFRDTDLNLPEKDNLLLYYVGMFYNLFLPGGIGGDGFKVYLLHRDTNAPVRNLLQAVFFDRLTGMVALGALSFLLGWIAFPEIPYRALVLLASVLCVPLWYLINYLFARKFQTSFWSTSFLSFGVQGLQILSALSILVSLGISDFTSAYLTVFLVSSLVSVLPISIGGIGVRELVFIAAAGFCPIAKDEAVAFSFLFFLITAISCLPGGLLSAPSFKK